MNLNHQQKEIVESPLEPLLVIASAGTGKTRVLTERIIYLLKQPSILPTNILAITFTNLAAEEMKKRISERIKNSCDIPSAIGTIHSLFGEILRRDVEKVCSRRDHKFEIIQEDGQNYFLNESFIQKCKRRPDRNKIRDVKNLLSKWKIGRYFGKDALTDIECGYYEDVFEEYEYTLQKKNLMDYDDVLILAHKLFEENHDIRDFWRNRFKAILIDECQDLNEIQWRLIKHLISDENSNFLMVGDPNQCIYIFNGAKEDIFEDVQKEFPNLIIKSLDENYRSAKEIVELSNKVKVINTNKSIPARDYLGEIVTSDNSEIPLKQLLSTNDFSKWAVLFKKHSDSNLIINFFIENNIPFRTSSFRLLDDPLVKKVICFLQIAFFDNWDPVKNLIRYGFLDFDWGTRYLLYSKGNFPGCVAPMFWFLKTDKWQIFRKKLPSEEMDKLKILVESLQWIRSVPKNNLFELAQQIRDRWFFDKELSNTDKRKWDSFLIWLKHLQSEFTDEASENLILNLRSYAEFSKEDIKNNEHNSVTLSTIHKTKGLEWDNVIILGYKKLESEVVDKTEDKHLAYVAITRARDKLFIVLDK